MRFLFLIILFTSCSSVSVISTQNSKGKLYKISYQGNNNQIEIKEFYRNNKNYIILNINIDDVKDLYYSQEKVQNLYKINICSENFPIQFEKFTQSEFTNGKGVDEYSFGLFKTPRVFLKTKQFKKLNFVKIDNDSIKLKCIRKIDDTIIKIGN